MKHPFLQSGKNLYIYFTVWLVLAIVQAAALHFWQGLPLLWSLFDGLIFNLTYGAMALSFWHTTTFIAPHRSSLAAVVLSHTSAAIFSTAIWLGLCHIVLDIIAPGKVYTAFVESALLWRFLLGILFYLLIVSANYVFLYAGQLREQELTDSKLKHLLRETELKSLRYQLNPHFLFNSLNSIYALTLSEPQKAGEMTVKLGEYLRTTLAETDRATTTLRDELNAMKLYIDIEKTRFGEKIRLEEEIASDCLDLPIPVMLLQPLFENAIKHGVYESLGDVQLSLKGERNGAFLKLRLQNTFDPSARSFRGLGIGLKNLQERLTLIYDHSNLLDVEQDDTVFNVKIFIPITAQN